MEDLSVSFSISLPFIKSSKKSGWVEETKGRITISCSVLVHMDFLLQEFFELEALGGYKPGLLILETLLPQEGSSFSVWPQENKVGVG